MCGIGGAIGSALTPELRDRLIPALSESLAQRGPDHQGHHADEDVLFVHTRLSIIDLKTGDQPLFSDRCAIIANGEIYNYQRLTRDHALTSLKTHSDIEPILPLYEKHGAKAFDLVEGMYAVAIHDRQDGSVVLARDKFGIKPLYYAQLPGLVLFASTIKALLATGLVEPRPDWTHIRRMLDLSFGMGRDTQFEGIKRVLPGETIRIKDDRVETIGSSDFIEWGLDAEKPDADLDFLLHDAVKLHALSDVPIGLFMSSGVDSTTVSTCLADLGHTGLPHYTADFQVEGFANETPDARRFCEFNKGEFIPVEITRDMVRTAFPDLVGEMDDLNFDTSMIPQYFMAREARKDVKVILGGNGGDEVFAGYYRYSHYRIPFNAVSNFRRIPRFGGRLFRDGAKSGFHGELMSLLTPEYRERLDKLQQRQALDLLSYMPSFHLTTMDRQLMRWGVEGRTPLLHEQLALAGFFQPPGDKMQGKRTKAQLRDWLDAQPHDYKPEAKKKGFSVPISDLFMDREDEVRRYIYYNEGVAGLLKDGVRKAILDGGSMLSKQQLFVLFIFAVWFDVHFTRDISRYEMNFAA